MEQAKQAVFVPESSSRIDKTLFLGAPVSTLKYVAPKRAEALSHLGIETIRDLLLHLPTRYLDYSELSSIAAAQIGEKTTIVGTVDRIKTKVAKRFVITEVYIVDNTGVLRLTFFRQAWISQQLAEGDVVAASGEVTFGYGYKGMNAPFWEKLQDSPSAIEEDATAKAHLARIISVHRLTQGLTAAWMRRIMASALQKIAGMLDFMPIAFLEKHQLIAEGSAYQNVHFPESLELAEQARRRLAYDELICLQIALRARHVFFKESQLGRAHQTEGEHACAFKRALPFSLTSEQERAVQEILADMASDRPMNRLLLGDVGTGKTIVAAHALAAVADSNAQAAVMVPTSVLATQYAEKVGPLLNKAHITWACITGATPKAERIQQVRRIAKGEVQVVFGTQALLSEDIQFARLSLIIVDEQHRFGVEQRAHISEKGKLADMLSMTATPIPRTLALSLYGDVEVSRITKRPNPGAGTTTHVITPENLDLAWGAIDAELTQGHQAYIVCPRIEDSEEKTQDERKLHSAESVYEQVSRGVLKKWRVGLLTGDLKAAEKDEVMSAFKAHELDVLVATTVIEVGVDVPNATVLLVFDADRFGLATLHQLRGRVGRGTVQGQVFLESPYSQKTAGRNRLSALEKTNDGFELAELDLKLRHEGDIVGLKQSGMTTLRIADLVEDVDLIEAAHEDVSDLLAIDPMLTNPVHIPLVAEVRSRYRYFGKSGART